MLQEIKNNQDTVEYTTQLLQSDIRQNAMFQPKEDRMRFINTNTVNLNESTIKEAKQYIEADMQIVLALLAA